jgi:GMP synthase (glutamine-hydrolysing)
MHHEGSYRPAPADTLPGMRILVLQHIACEPPGVFEDAMIDRGADLHRVELDEGEPLPALDGFDAVVAMGGPMSVNDHAEHPWLVGEQQLVREAVERGVPFWGSCLGVQLLAASLGARVYAGPAPEVGVLPVELTPAAVSDPVFAGLPSRLATLQWHGDTFELPAGAVLLATSPAYPNQAFRVGPSAYGVQFHVEVTPAMADEWATIPAYAAYADRVLGEGGSHALLEEFRAGADAMQAHGRGMFERWLDLVRPA